MYRLVVLTEQGKTLERFFCEEDLQAIEARFAAFPEPEDAPSAPEPDAVLLPLDAIASMNARQLVERCHELGLPVIAAVPARRMDQFDASLGVDDFLLQPFRPGELVARIAHLLHRLRKDAGPNLIQTGDLVIDQDRYEVAVGGRKALLTFKEYQLLVLLASNPGRVYTREALLSQVWGYDYFGGTRTVDVHVRRLRSKLEDATHSFVETVWNVGYRFKPQD